MIAVFALPFVLGLIGFIDLENRGCRGRSRFGERVSKTGRLAVFRWRLELLRRKTLDEEFAVEDIVFECTVPNFPPNFPEFPRFRG